MRKRVYHSLDDEFHEKEMKKILISDDWYCYFFVIDEHQPIGFVEISSRNIVDVCPSSPVAYLEGLFIKKEYRRRGLGREAIKTIKNWCKEIRIFGIGYGYRAKEFTRAKVFQGHGF